MKITHESNYAMEEARESLNSVLNFVTLNKSIQKEELKKYSDKLKKLIN